MRFLCLSQSKGPDSDPGEEMALCVSLDVVRCDIFNAPVIDIARRNQPGLDKFPQALCCKGIVLVVISSHDALRVPQAKGLMRSAISSTSIGVICSQASTMGVRTTFLMIPSLSMIRGLIGGITGS